MEKLGFEDIENFMIQNLHYLSNNTKAESLIPFLRKRNCLTQFDEDSILALKTSKERSEKLVNIMKYKGKKCFVAYMEVLEHTYPLAHDKICKHANANNYDDNDCDLSATTLCASRASVELIKEIYIYMGAIMNENTMKKENIEHLQDTFWKLKFENESMLKNMGIMECQLREKEDTVDTFQNNNKDQEDKIQDLVKENKTLKLKLVTKEKDLVKLSKQKSQERNKLLPKIFDEKTLSENFTTVEDRLKKITNSLTNKTQENKTLNEISNQLLDYNKRLETDLTKARQQNHQQRRTIYDLNEDNSYLFAAREGGMKIKRESSFLEDKQQNLTKERKADSIKNC